MCKYSDLVVVEQRCWLFLGYDYFENLSVRKTSGCKWFCCSVWGILKLLTADLAIYLSIPRASHKVFKVPLFWKEWWYKTWGLTSEITWLEILYLVKPALNLWMTKCYHSQVSLFYRSVRGWQWLWYSKLLNTKLININFYPWAIWQIMWH